MKVDMSPEAVTRRLKLVGELARTCFLLGQFKKHQAKLVMPERAAYGNSQKVRDNTPTPAQSEPQRP